MGGVVGISNGKCSIWKEQAEAEVVPSSSLVKLSQIKIN